MVSSTSKILDSGYSISLCKSYTGNKSKHRVWYVYPDDTGWYWSDSHGNQPSTKTCKFSFSVNKYRDDPVYSPSYDECSFVSKFTGLEYTVHITNRWAKTFSKRSLMGISEVHIAEYATPGSTETVTVDIYNEGGEGKFDLVLLEGVVEIDRVSGASVSDGSSVRKTLEFDMLNTSMTLTIRLIDLYDDATIEDVTCVVKVYDPCGVVVCSPMCFGTDYYNTVCDEGTCVQGSLITANYSGCGYVPPEEPDVPDEPYDPVVPDYDEFIDIIMDNKELAAAGVIAGIVIIS